MDITNLYQALVRLLSNIVDAHTVALFVVDSKTRQFHLLASQSLSKDIPENLSLTPEQSGLLSQVYKLGQTIDLDKPPQDIGSMLPFYRNNESYIKGIFAVPVGNVEGVLYVDTKKSWGFNEKEQKWIREVAAIFRDLLEKQGALNQQEDYARILKLWYHLEQGSREELSLDNYFHLVVEKCSRFLDADYGFLAAGKQGEKNRYELVAYTSNIPQSLTKQDFSADQGLVGWVLQNRKALLISKLNPELQEHFLFSPAEALPHSGTFWGLPISIAPNYIFMLGFLGRQPIQWDSDEQYAVSRFVHFLHLFLEQLYWKEEYKRLQSYDLSTGLHNALTFENTVEEMISTSMQNSVPFTLSLLQLEPWQILYTRGTPREVRQWQQRFTLKLSKMFPEQVLIGQITENRYALLFPGITYQEADKYLLPLTSVRQQIPTRHMEKISLQIYSSQVSYPQDGMKGEQLWPLLYHRLFTAFRF